MVAWLGPAISAGASLIGGLMNSKATDKANQQAQQHAAAQMKMQQDFAQHGIKWKVDDARDAGIHPLYALGANTVSYSPVSVGNTPNTSMGNALSAAGQDISRAVSAGTSPAGRVRETAEAMNALQLENAALNNDMLRAQIAKLNAQVPPPVPAVPGSLKEGKLDDATPLMIGGDKMSPNLGWSDGQTFEDRWGEWGGSAAGLAVMGSDLAKYLSAHRAALQKAYPINLRARGSLRENSRNLLNRY